MKTPGPVIATAPIAEVDGANIWEGTEDMPWPGGITYDEGYYRFMWAFIWFLLCYKKPCTMLLAVGGTETHSLLDQTTVFSSTVSLRLPLDANLSFTASP